MPWLKISIHFGLGECNTFLKEPSLCNFCPLESKERQFLQKHMFFHASVCTMGDGSLICPVRVHKIITPPPGVSWVPRDQKLDVEDRSIHFMLILLVIIVK